MKKMISLLLVFCMVFAFTGTCASVFLLLAAHNKTDSESVFIGG